MTLQRRAPIAELPLPPTGKLDWPWLKPPLPEPRSPSDRVSLPVVSIVVPSFNQAEFVEETLRSILLQAYPALELIVIDGGSSDGTVEILKKYSPWLDHWTSEPDRGQSHALNKGFAHATGEIAGYLNSDDVLRPGALAQVAAAFADRLDQPVLAAFSGNDFDESGVVSEYRPPHSCPRLHVWLSSEASLHQPSTFWTAALHRRVGEFDESLRFCMDKDFFLRAIFEHGTYMGVRGEPVAGFRRHAESKTATLEAAKWEENARLWKKYRAMPHYLGRLAEEYRHLAAESHLDHARSAGRASDRWRSFVRAAACRPGFLVSRPYWGAVRRALLGRR